MNELNKSVNLPAELTVQILVRGALTLEQGESEKVFGLLKKGLENLIAQKQISNRVAKEFKQLKQKGKIIMNNIKFISKIDAEIREGGPLCKHASGKSYTYIVFHDCPSLETIREKGVVTEHRNTYHIGCCDSEGIYRVQDGTFVIQYRVQTNLTGSWIWQLEFAHATPSGDQELIQMILEKPQNARKYYNSILPMELNKDLVRMSIDSSYCLKKLMEEFKFRKVINNKGELILQLWSQSQGRWIFLTDAYRGGGNGADIDYIKSFFDMHFPHQLRENILKELPTAVTCVKTYPQTGFPFCLEDGIWKFKTWDNSEGYRVRGIIGKEDDFVHIKMDEEFEKNRFKLSGEVNTYCAGPCREVLCDGEEAIIDGYDLLLPLKVGEAKNFILLIAHDWASTADPEVFGISVLRDANGIRYKKFNAECNYKIDSFMVTRV